MTEHEGIDLTPCPDCGACPAATRCECDFVGIRAARTMQAYRDALEGLRPFAEEWAGHAAADTYPILRFGLSFLTIGMLRNVREALKLEMPKGGAL